MAEKTFMFVGGAGTQLTGHLEPPEGTPRGWAIFAHCFTCGKDSRAAVHVSRALMCYAPGLLVFSLNKVLTPWFHAQKDTKTPMQIALAMVGANLALNILMVLTLPDGWKHAGIAGSTVVCSLVSCVWLVRKASRRNGRMGLRALAKPALRMAAACFLMAIMVLLVRSGVHAAMEPGRLAALAVVGLGVAAAMAVYGVAVWRLCPESTHRVLMIRRRRGG